MAEINQNCSVSNYNTEQTDEDISINVNPFVEELNLTSSNSVIELTPPEVIELSSETEQTVDASRENEQHTKCKYFDLGCQKLVILSENHSVPFYGLCSLKVLHGKLKILGYAIDKKSKELQVYSPRGSSLLVVTNVTDNEEDDDDVQSFLNSNEHLRHLKTSKTDLIFVCTLLEDPKVTFIEKYISQQIFPKLGTSKSPQIIFEPKDKFNEIKINPQWNSILHSVNASTNMLIVGGKGVGKSTFLKYSINTLLNRFEKIRIVDLDPGQSEFSVPGCISALTVSEPVLGPNYTHLRTTDRSYLSNINVGHEPRKYVQCIKTLFESLDLAQDLPTLINYMGYAHGIGLNIVSSAITIIRPTDVVQINSKVHKKNFATDISSNVVKKNCTLFGKYSNDLHFNLIKLSAMSDKNSGWSLEPRQVREMCVLAYFGRLGSQSLTDHNVPMYKIYLDSVAIVDDQGRSISAAAGNANLVALCSSIDKDFFNVLGYGIIRGVNIQSKRLVLITPEPIDVLEKVTYLVLSSVSLPPSIQMTPNGITGKIPYVMEGELESLGQITRRTYIPISRI